MSEDRSEELLRRAAETYNSPPEPPRERIWARIQTERSAGRETQPRAARASDDRSGDGPGFRRRLALTLRLHPARLWWPIGVAAVLLIGIVIGRMLPTESQHTQIRTDKGDRVSGAEHAPHEKGHSAALLRHAVAPYLGSVETLLTLVESEKSGFSSTEPITDWAEELLAETRLLRDSPVREDEELQLLLDDLELVLVRIVRLSGPQHAEAQQWIRDGIRDRSLLLRLRGRLPAEEACGGA